MVKECRMAKHKDEFEESRKNVMRESKIATPLGINKSFSLKTVVQWRVPLSQRERKNECWVRMIKLMTSARTSERYTCALTIPIVTRSLTMNMHSEHIPVTKVLCNDDFNRCKNTKQGSKHSQHRQTPVQPELHSEETTERILLLM